MQTDDLMGGAGDAAPAMAEASPAAGKGASSGSGSGKEICVPASALAMPDDQEQMTEPEPGDAVTLQMEAKVTRIEGEMAYVMPQTVNGVQMPDASEENEPGEGTPSEEQQDASDYADLENSARGQMLS